MKSSQLSFFNSQLPKGYRQTEVGILPEDWTVVSMGELFTFQNGVNADKAAYGKGIPFINVLEIIKHSTLVETSIPGRVLLPAQTISAFKVQTGDVLFNRTSETQEEVGLASVYIDNSEVVFGGFVIRARPRNGCLDPIFSSYALRSPIIRQQIISRGQGAVRANIGQQELSKVQVFVPPLPEQEAIAEALSDKDALIESLEQLIVKKRQIKQGAMQELLTGRRRLPGVEKRPLVKTEIGTFPEDWVPTYLGALVDPARSIRYGIVQPGNYDSSGRFMIRGQDYSKGWANPTSIFRVSENVELRYKNARVKAGDLIMTIVGTCGIVETIPDWLDGANLTQTTARVAINSKKADSRFCKYILQTEVGAKQVIGFMKGGVQPGLNCGDVERFLIPLPSNLEEQADIANILSDIDAEITTLESKLAKARQIKQGMMHILLTVSIRLV